MRGAPYVARRRYLAQCLLPGPHMQIVHAEDGVWGCTAVGYCSEVCPKQVDPANAVNQNKTASAIDYFLRFVMPKGASQ